MTRARSFTIRPAEAGDAPHMPAIENSAGTLFRTAPGLAWVADGEDLSAERYAEIIGAGSSWVAVEDGGNLVGFISCADEGDALHIWELAVVRDRQGGGVGRALIDEAIGAARARGLAAVTLTTFRDVAWNAPFYERLGFERLTSATTDPRLAALLDAEVDRGLPPELRCAMQLMLDAR